MDWGVQDGNLQIAPRKLPDIHICCDWLRAGELYRPL